MNFSKTELRKTYKQKRASLTEKESALLNRRLLEAFQVLPFSSIGYFHFFLPIRKFNEPNTFLMIDWLKANHPEIKCVVSRCDTLNRTMEHFCDVRVNELIENAWGIPEPMGGVPVSPEQLDAVLVPLLIFDNKGQRVGYGQGFYDRFLSECRDDCMKLGVSFFEPIDNIGDTDAYDVPLDACITPQGLWLPENFSE